MTKVAYYTSSTADGSMKSVHTGEINSVNHHRAAFLRSHAIDPEHTTLVRLTYDRSDYLRYRTLTESDLGDGIVRTSTIISDALVATQPGHALFLPLADCIGAVIHDPTQNILMVSHLGRHNLEQFGGTKCIEYLVRKHNSNPKDLQIWLSPAAGKDHYPLFAFNDRSLHDVAIEQLAEAGIPKANIDASPIDSAADSDYFSHSQFPKGKRETDGRFAIVAVMR